MLAHSCLRSPVTLKYVATAVKGLRLQANLLWQLALSIVPCCPYTGSQHGLLCLSASKANAA